MPEKLKLTHYPNTPVNVRAAGRIVELDDLDALREFILDTASNVGQKGASGYYVAAPVEGVRSNANTQPTRLVALDWDDVPGGVAPGEHPGLYGLRWFAHTTDSHTDAEPRWRVWVELDREYSAAEVGAAQSPIEGAHLRAASQPAFVPTRVDDMVWAYTVTGAPLALTSWGARQTAPAEPASQLAVLTSPQPRQPTQAATNALVARWLGRPEGTNRLAGATGAVLASWGWSDEAIAAWLRSLLSAGDPKVEKHINDAVRAARTRRDGGTVPGLPTLVAELGVPFEYVGAAALAAGVFDPEPARSTEGPAVDADGWVTAAAVCAWEPPPVDWLVEGLALAPGAPVLLTGYGGSGKTTLAQHLAVCVAARGPSVDSVPKRVLGVLDVNRPGPVTHIDYEQGIELTARRYRDLGLQADQALRYRAPPTPTPGLGADLQARGWLLDAARDQRLVLVDSLVAGLGAALDDENAANTREPLDFLGRVSAETGAIVVVIHHSRKLQRGGDARQTARGSSAITDAVSVHLNYERSGDSGALLRLAKLRRSPPAGLLSGLLGDGVLVTADMTLGRAGGEAQALSVDVLNVLATTDDPRSEGLSTASVAKALGLKPSGEDWGRVRTALEALSAEGTVLADGAGRTRRWRLA